MSCIAGVIYKTSEPKIIDMRIPTLTFDRIGLLWIKEWARKIKDRKIVRIKSKMERLL